MPIRIVDALQGLFDPVHRTQRECQGDGRMLASRDRLNRIECRFDLCRPTLGLAILDEVADARGAVDRAPEPVLQRLRIISRGGSCQIQLAQQDRVGFGLCQNDLDQGFGTLLAQMGRDARKYVIPLRYGIKRICRERRGDHVLAEAPILERWAGAFSADVFSPTGNDGAIILRPGYAGQDPLSINTENLYGAIRAVSLSPFEDGITRERTQRGGIEPR